MAFTKVNNASGSYWQPGLNVTMTMTTGIAINAGALITKAAGAADVALFTASAPFKTLPIFAVSNQTVTSSATTVDVQMVQAGDVFEVDIDEIINATTLTATGGSATTFVHSTLKAVPDSFLIGAKFQVLSMASGDKVVGTILTATGYTNSTGTITFASLGATGFASSDTIKILSVNNDYVSGTVQGVLNSTADNLKIVGALPALTSNLNWFRVIGATASGPLGGTKDGNKLILAVTSGCDVKVNT